MSSETDNEPRALTPAYLDGRGAGPDEVARLARFGLLLAIATGVVFTLLPQLDIAVSALFLMDNGSFALTRSAFWKFVRELFLRGFTIWYVVIVVAGIIAGSRQQPVLKLTWPRWLYMGLCAIAGPLLVTNVWLKEEWGRWRPREIEQLGGRHEFTTPLDPTGTCMDNCSFVSGEVSTTAMVFISLALVSGTRRIMLYWLAAAMTSISILIRVGQGGHFLSDSLFAVAFMVLIAAGIYRLMFLGSPPLANENDVDWPRLRSAVEWPFAKVSAAGLRLLDRIAPKR